MKANSQFRTLAAPAILSVILQFATIPIQSTSAGTVSSVQGNIVYANDANVVMQLTNNGKDTDPELSPDGKQIVFVRDTPGIQADTPQGRLDVDELWLIGADGSNAHRVLRGHADDEPRRSVAGIGSPSFSPDGRVVYFMSAGWVTSSGIHAIGVDGGALHFVTDGNSLEVIRSGKYRGYLIVNKHDYNDQGAYDAFWLVSPSGQKIQNIGENDVDVSSFKSRNN